VPIIKFSVDLVEHAASARERFRFGGAYHRSFDPLPASPHALGFTFFFITLLFLRVRSEFWRPSCGFAAAGR